MAPAALPEIVELIAAFTTEIAGERLGSQNAATYRPGGILAAPKNT